MAAPREHSSAIANTVREEGYELGLAGSLTEAREELIHAISTGADDYLPRSSGPGVWKARLHAHVRRKQLEDENQAIREHMVLQEAEVNGATADC